MADNAGVVPTQELFIGRDRARPVRNIGTMLNVILAVKHSKTYTMPALSAITPHSNKSGLSFFPIQKILINKAFTH
jgi:hypothetical protein